MKIQSRDNGLPQCGSVTSKGPTCIESNTMAFGWGGGGGAKGFIVRSTSKERREESNLSIPSRVGAKFKG